MSETEQPEVPSGADSSSSAYATQVPSAVTKINQDDGASSNEPGNLSGESSSTLVASQTAIDVLEEEQPADDDPTAPLVAPRHEDADPPIIIVDDRTTEPPVPPPLRPSWIQCMCCCFITTYNLHYTRKVRNSKYILFVLVALLSIPISSIYFGITYKDSCPMAQFSPLLLIIMGVVGVIFIIARLMTISTRRGLWKVEEPPKTIAMSLTGMLMFFMLMEMISFYSQKPDFDHLNDSLFCEKTFYDYVFYMNFGVLVIGILALMLHVPKKFYRPMQGTRSERFDVI